MFEIITIIAFLISGTLLFALGAIYGREKERRLYEDIVCDLEELTFRKEMTNG